MSSAWLGRAVHAVGLLALAGAACVAAAAESLPPLRVDPTLLGGAPLKPAPPPTPAPAAASAVPASPATPSAETAAAAVPAPSRPGVEVKPVAPPPAARELGATPTARATPSATVAPETAPARTAPPVPVASTARTLQNLPPLRVDPALLGGTAQARQGVKPEIAEPPQVAERADIPPLYSAHVAAGMIPHPSTTPMSHVGKGEAPTIVVARRISGVNDVELIAEGNAELIRAGDSLRADRIIYRVPEDEVESVGNVVLTSPDTRIAGPRMRMRMEEGTGEFDSPAYAIRREQKPIDEPAMTLTGLPAITTSGKAIAKTGRTISLPPVTGSGVAERMEFRGEDQYRLSKASYSTCKPGQRDWEIYIDELDLDYNAEVGKGRGATVRFMDVPIFYTPYINFSLNNDKKSGFLPATLGSSSDSGFEVAAPWFWNIAPDMDATITPRYMTKRGLQMSSEFRYLLDDQHNRNTLLANPALNGNALPDKGMVRFEYLDDSQYEKKRWGYSVMHTQNFPSLLRGHNVATMLNLNGVSDSDYFNDLSSRIQSTSLTNLSKAGSATLGGPWYTAAITLQSWQTLHNLTSPYRTLPAITATANRFDLPLGLALNFNASYVDYDHPDYVLVKRTALYPQLSLPLTTGAFWLTPKVGVHAAYYTLSGQDRPLAQTQWKNVDSSQNRSIPIYSVDGGVIFERDTQLFGQSYLQTLEPRAFYTYIPRRDQSQIPVMDSGVMDFNYATMFTENRYSGNDRIGDANQLTLAATSRILDPTSGAEVLRALMGTRYYFSTQYQGASMPGETMRSGRSADLLASLAGRMTENIFADTAWQYNPRDARTERFNLTLRYRPEAGKILNTSYRFARGIYDTGTQKISDVDQIDVSAQWPLAGGWYGVGRYNYSLEEKRVIEVIGGLEYNAGCWVSRFVVQRQAVIADNPKTALFFQLELNDFAKIGSNPLNLLRRNIPGYGVINQPTADPVFAEY